MPDSSLQSQMWLSRSESDSCHSCCDIRTVLESCKSTNFPWVYALKTLMNFQFVEEQAIDRVHRLTQKTDVVVYKITIENSVEQRILELQDKKRELANQAIEGGAKANASKLGMKELLQLFRRDAEYMHPTSSAGSYSIAAKPSVLRGPS